MFNHNGRQIPDTFEEIVAPHRSALLICDMQKWFCNPDSGKTYTFAPKPANQEEAIQNNVTLLNSARKAGVKVVYTQYTTLRDGLSDSDYSIYKRKKFGESSIGAEKTIEGSEGWEVIDEIKPRVNELIIRKNRRNAFIGSNLHNILRINGIRTLVLIGRTLEWGIWANAWMAEGLDYFNVLAKDAIMGRNPVHMEEALHWFERETIISDVRRISEAWERTPI
jgi:ureidoacrylate peracid hydrolase